MLFRSVASPNNASITVGYISGGNNNGNFVFTLNGGPVNSDIILNSIQVTFYYGNCTLAMSYDSLYNQSTVLFTQGQVGPITVTVPGVGFPCPTYGTQVDSFRFSSVKLNNNTFLFSGQTYTINQTALTVYGIQTCTPISCPGSSGGGSTGGGGLIIDINDGSTGGIGTATGTFTEP